MRDQGFLGAHGVALVSRIVREGLRRFPALKDHDPDDVVQGFFVDRIQTLTATLLAQATNDDSFGRIIRRWVQNWMIDQARKTGTGALRRAIEKVLDETPEFEKVPSGSAGAGRWRLANTGGQPWGGDTGQLVAVAWAVPNVRVPKWSSSSRRPPVADRTSLVAIAHAILDQAGGSLEIAQLVYVFSQRFAASLDPIVVSFDESVDDGIDDDAAGVDLPSQTASPEEAVIAESIALDVTTAAAEIVRRLSSLECAVIPVLDDSAAVRERLSLGRSQSALFVSSLKAKIRSLAGTGEDQEDIVREVIALCGGPAAA
ncbi:hypothetical protein B8W69_28730 [Mycobacterium vulneris]|uniref:Uncharacterized protein n=1 Tax=Mycolicibacterium vulneris TaxID=547163 RepID=A0A1X2KIB6_9MYCO|nr:hypothetical protein [Mycolicibacterium vulneris]OSC20871.1 hypothetical protein B8W69_28730 [Mycolicibacterium vulneris]